MAYHKVQDLFLSFCELNCAYKKNIQKVRACVRFYIKRAKKKCKLFENLGKHVGNLKIF